MNQRRERKPREVGGKPTPVAIYVRMSTEHQRYSIAHQKAALSAFAAEKAFEIVRTYCDSGRSGVTFERRPALRQMMSDIIDNKPPYHAVLVYDVSRWGRYQDVDESAFYEFICRKSGKQVIYVAESFANDGTPIAALMKAIKRTMAGEYSRELSGKVRVAHHRLAAQGLFQGGRTPFGIQKWIAEPDSPPRLMRPFERAPANNMSTIFFRPGPRRETELVKMMFDQFVEGRCLADVARAANQTGMTTRTGKAWTHVAVRYVLENPIYAGDFVYRRTCVDALGGPIRRTSPHERICVRGVLEPTVEPSQFKQAAKLLDSDRSKKIPDAELLRKLREIFRRDGHLSYRNIASEAGMPTVDTVMNRFGDLGRLRRLVGKEAERSSVSRCGGHWARRAKADALDALAERFRASGFKVEPRDGYVLAIEGVRVLLTTFAALKRNSLRTPVITPGAAEVLLILKPLSKIDAAIEYYLLPMSGEGAGRVLHNRKTERHLATCRARSLDEAHRVLLTLLEVGSGGRPARMRHAGGPKTEVFHRVFQLSSAVDQTAPTRRIEDYRSWLIERVRIAPDLTQKQLALELQQCKGLKASRAAIARFCKSHGLNLPYARRPRRKETARMTLHV